MSRTMDVSDVAMRIAEKGSFSFTDYEPRDLPGYESNIAKLLGASPNQTENLLRAVDELEEDHHYIVTRRVDRERTDDRKVTPAIIRVTISAA